MTKKLYLHIGASKTGTSALQCYLRDNRDTLRAQGYLYPRSQRYNHHPLAMSVIAGFTDFYKSRKHLPFGGKYKSLWQVFRDEVDQSDCSVVLLSSEAFPDLVRAANQQRAKRMIGWIGDQLKDIDVYVVCYLRPLDAFMNSYYRYVVKDRGVHSTMAEWMDSQIRQRTIYAAPTTYLDLFAEQFGSEKMILRRYDRETLVNGSIIDDFASVVGMPEPVDGFGTLEAHPSLPNDKVDMMRIYNAVERDIRQPLAKDTGRKMARLPSMSFGTRPADGGKAIQEALANEHYTIAERYGLDLGEVGDPFENTSEGPIEGQGAMALMAMTWKDVRALRNEIKKERQGVQILKRGSDAARKAIKRLSCSSFVSFTKRLLWKLRKLRTRLAGSA